MDPWKSPMFRSSSHRRDGVLPVRVHQVEVVVTEDEVVRGDLGHPLQVLRQHLHELG
jgi:hypothetical protein